MRRRAYHAGSWYSGDPVALGRELDGYLAAAHPPASGRCKALVSPHAGYRYCGATAAWGFKSIDRSTRRVFVLGPSHHVYLSCCALPAPSCEAYDTPLGQISLDAAVLDELRQTGAFAEFSLAQDEEEHSVEMQLPFTKHIMEDRPFTLVPVVVGSLDHAAEARYGKIFAKYFDCPDTLFIISSDFCHWGRRFNYTRLWPEPSCQACQLPAPVYDRCTQVNSGIEALDRQGMSHIVSQDVRSFQEYLARHQNTICGRHPICVFMELLKNSRTGPRCRIEFVHYSQSQVMPDNPSPHDSCVSYASGLCVCSG